MIYLDNNATTPLDPEVLQEIQVTLSEAWGNPSSGHSAGVKAKNAIVKARASVAEMLGAKPSDIVFTSGGTEGNNMILQTAVKQFWSTCKSLTEFAVETAHCKQLLPHFVSSNLEHDSICLVLEQLKQEGLADVTFVPASTSSGRVEVEDVISAIRPTTCMVTVMLANNETGILQPVSEICKCVRALDRSRPKGSQRILLHTDAAQAIGKIPVNVDDLDVDYLTVVGHKFYGPRVGAIYVRDLENGSTPLYPMLFGGGQERNYRPGTENTGMIAGLGRAAELVVHNIDKYEAGMREVRDYLEQRLQEEFRDKVKINGKYELSERIPNTSSVSFVGEGLEGHKMLGEMKRVQASVGAACHVQNRVSPILLASGVSETLAKNALRLSVGRHTTKEDIDVIIADIKQALLKLSPT